MLITNETNPLTLPNDTISRLTELSDYYAYDDGTAEASLSLAPASTGPPSYYALRFDLNRPDQVRAIRLYPVLGTAAGRIDYRQHLGRRRHWPARRPAQGHQKLHGARQLARRARPSWK